MSISFSKDESKQIKVLIDNVFFTEYMPFAPDGYLKVYLLGLSLACSPSCDEAGIELISAKLGVAVGIVEEAFRYWEGQGLVNILETSPISIEYLQIKPQDRLLKKFSKEKYKTFNNQLHAMLPNRSFLPNEYNEYYSTIEAYHFEIEAMLMIIAYCVRLKGENITYQYIIAVARNMALDGYTTYDRVQERLNELDLAYGEMGKLLTALKLKRSPDHEDRRLFLKWTKQLGFSPDTIVFVARSIKKGGMERLDSTLTKYYENRLMDRASINLYNEKRDSMFALAKEINRIIGVYYEQLDYIIETYINKWLSYGFTETALLTTAEYCFRRNVRTIEGLNEILMRFYKEGLLTLDSINGFIGEAVEIDNQIKNIMESAGVNRKITSWDRDYYRTWTFSWGMPMDVILFAAECSTKKANPLGYMNAILSAWNESSIKTVDEAKRAILSKDSLSNQKNTPFVAEIPSQSRSYTNEEINAMFDRLRPEDI